MLPLAQATELGQVMTLYSKMGIRAVVWGAIGAAFGYTFASFSLYDPLSTARACGIAAFVNALFIEFVKTGYSDKEGGNKIKRNRIYVLWTTFAGLAGLCYLNEAGCISKGLLITLGATLIVANLAISYFHVFKLTYLYANALDVPQPQANL